MMCIDQGNSTYQGMWDNTWNGNWQFCCSTNQFVNTANISYYSTNNHAMLTQTGYIAGLLLRSYHAHKYKGI